jgi:WD repeat-containing protein 68
MGQHNSSQAPQQHQQPPPSQQQQQQPQQQQPQQQQQQQQQQQLYNSPDQYSASTAPNINLQQATPQGSHYTNAPSSNVPGSLQPGSNSQRPGPASAYTAPTTVPTMPHISTNAQQYTLPTRSNTMNASHSSHPSHTYSRSSPAGLEQKYIPFSNTPENPKYAATPGQKYYTATTPSGAASNSPLGLADIRPRANSNMENETLGGGTFFNDSDRVPSNSNYLAPWGVYAYDWCKWPVHGGNSAGKMAVGSYLEDTHNFVNYPVRTKSGIVLPVGVMLVSNSLPRYKFSILKYPHKKSPYQARHPSA